MLLHKACMMSKHAQAKNLVCAICIQTKSSGSSTALFSQIFKINASARLFHMNANDFLNRIGYKGSVAPNLENLGRLSQMHKASVPYTNVEIVNRTRKLLDLEILYQRIVVDESGGTCHEINGLFTWLLRQLGYEVSLYNCRYYIEKSKEFSVWAGHSLPFVDLGKEGTFLVDPGLHVTGPMKFEMMTPHVETHGVYRFRRAHGTEKDFYLERHRKSVYYASGELMKQGPAPEGRIGGKCDDECLKEESSHWKATHLFRAEPVDLNYFQIGMDELRQRSEFTARNLILFLYHKSGYHSIFGRHYLHKLCPNPVTEVIEKEVEVTSDEQICQVARDYFNYEVKEKVKIFERNLLD